MPIRFGVLLAVICLALAGCNRQSNDARLLLTGPGQSFDPTAVAAFSDQRVEILKAIKTASGFDASAPLSPTQWKQFGITAFDFADEQCETYITALRRLDILRRETGQELNLVGSATAGVLGLARAAGSAIAGTAIAFGLAQATVDNVSSGLLYELRPSAIHDLVQRYRANYLAKLTKDQFSDQATTFRTVRGYVELCLPVVIESNVTGAVATHVPSVTTGGGVTNAPPLVASTQVIADVNGPRPPPPQPPGGGPASPSRLTPTEQLLTDHEIRSFQRALCVAADGDLGGETPTLSQTRTAIQEFVLGYRPGEPKISRIDDRIRIFLRQAAVDVPGCAASQFQGAFEVGRLGTIQDTAPSITAAIRVTDFLTKLAKVAASLPAPPIAVTPTGSLVGARDAIALIRVRLAIDPQLAGKVDRRFYDEILSRADGL